MRNIVPPPPTSPAATSPGRSFTHPVLSSTLSTIPAVNTDKGRSLRTSGSRCSLTGAAKPCSSPCRQAASPRVTAMVLGAAPPEPGMGTAWRPTEASSPTGMRVSRSVFAVRQQCEPKAFLFSPASAPLEVISPTRQNLEVKRAEQRFPAAWEHLKPRSRRALGRAAQARALGAPTASFRPASPLSGGWPPRTTASDSLVELRYDAERALLQPCGRGDGYRQWRQCPTGAFFPARLTRPQAKPGRRSAQLAPDERVCQ